ncbi:hypothetical protein U0070_019896 [Myodes glareolus]|uniref:Ribosomal protein L15 n=1 Tax=Myodes glareolus TaxID=447135 RepID=A0AAW0JK15_MYOGA
MGVYKYIQELWKKKQSDVIHLLLRAHCWQYHQLSVLHRSPNPTQPDKACGLGYRTKQSYVVRSSDTQWITTPIHKHREMHGLTSVGRKSQGKGHKFHHMALAMQPGEGAVSSSTVTDS